MKLSIALLLLLGCVTAHGQDTLATAQADSLLRAEFDSAMTGYFAEIGVPLDSCSNTELYHQVCSWLDAPYKYAGKTKNGIDCSGFAKRVYRHNYGLKLAGGSSDLFARCTAIPVEELEEGDLLFFKIYSDRISHVGVYLRDNKFAHATTSLGVIVSDLSEPYYAKRFYTGGRVILYPEEEESLDPVVIETGAESEESESDE